MAGFSMVAIGRKLPLNYTDFRLIERPLLIKADIQKSCVEPGQNCLKRTSAIHPKTAAGSVRFE
jgi:hypothetical protein